jgi:hypothetical protein
LTSSSRVKIGASRGGNERSKYHSGKNDHDRSTSVRRRASREGRARPPLVDELAAVQRLSLEQPGDHLAERQLRLLAGDRLAELVLPPCDRHVRELAVRLLDDVLLDDSGLGRSEFPEVGAAERRPDRPAAGLVGQTVVVEDQVDVGEGIRVAAGNRSGQQDRARMQCARLRARRCAPRAHAGGPSRQPRSTGSPRRHQSLHEPG